jgi:hypothetical protein
MWNHPAPQADDSVTRPATYPGASAPPPVRTPSALRRVLRVLIPTVVAAAVVAGFAAVALGNHLLGLGAPRPTSDCSPLPSGTISGATVYTPRAAQPSGSGSGSGTTGGATQASPISTITVYQNGKAPASVTTPPPAQTGAGMVHVCGVGFHAQSAIQFTFTRARAGGTSAAIPQAFVTTDGNGSFSAQVPAAYPAYCGAAVLRATDAQGTSATMTIPSRNLGIASPPPDARACAVP